jgi:hypothetical protein
LTQSVQKQKKKLNIPFSSVEIVVDVLSSGSGVSMKMNVKTTHTFAFLDVTLVVVAITAVGEALLAFAFRMQKVRFVVEVLLFGCKFHGYVLPASIQSKIVLAPRRVVVGTKKFELPSVVVE